jgi:hypothetical protein
MQMSKSIQPSSRERGRMRARQRGKRWPRLTLNHFGNFVYCGNYANDKHTFHRDEEGAETQAAGAPRTGGAHSLQDFFAGIPNSLTGRSLY